VLTLINRFAPNLFQYFFGIDYIYLLIVSILVVIFIIFKHIPNYKRMIKGEEKSFSKK
jgi:glycerol-3-phosphate acyltransferase PlsY